MLKQWIKKYQVFLFDFDGLLVNTEQLHYAAYKKMCHQRGFNLDWSFSRYLLAAHFESTGLEKQIYEKFPGLKNQEPNWPILYGEKKRAYMELIEKDVSLMPGAASFLELLFSSQATVCVVTHSPFKQIQRISGQHPILRNIEHWITREHYKHPKPHPECYLKAMETFKADPKNVIGFEDSPRGLKALKQSGAQSVWICPDDHPALDLEHAQDIWRYQSLQELL